MASLLLLNVLFTLLPFSVRLPLTLVLSSFSYRNVQLYFPESSLARSLGPQELRILKAMGTARSEMSDKSEKRGLRRIHGTRGLRGVWASREVKALRTLRTTERLEYYRALRELDMRNLRNSEHP